MENIPGFNLRAQVVGQGGAYVKHIQQETRCRVQIKGRGSGFLEHSTGQESDEPMYLHVASPDPEMVEKARKLCEDLLKTIRQNYEHFKANPPPQRMESYTDGYGADAHRGGGGYGGGGGGYGRRRDTDSYSSSYAGYSNSSANGAAYAASGYGTPTPTTPATTSAAPTDAQTYQDQWAAYYAQNPAADPYAQYGGYQAYMQYYYSYYGQQQQQPGQDGQQPAPPADGQQQQPPPAPTGYDYGQGQGAQSGYNAVPPPPGM